MKRADFEKEIEDRIKEAVLFFGEEQGWNETWPLDWRLDDAEAILGDLIAWAAPRNSHLTRRMANEMIRRYWRAGRLAKAFDEALKRAA